ncbi:MAG: sulfotransferase [Alphaproteobacteria bacterium]|nr:MAG: sulfotransferase [Alphaproteobacteria bacterium]
MNTHSQPLPSDLSFLPADQQLGLMNLSLAALKQNPRNVSALMTVAALFEAQKNHADAVATLHKVLALTRKDPEVLRRLVRAASAAGDLALARKHARKLAEIEPRVAFNHKQHGVILDRLGFPDAAIQAYLKADRIEPGSAETLHCIGRSYGMMGNHARALEYHEKALAADPAYGFALYAQSAAKKFTAAEAEQFVARVEAALPLASNAPVAAQLHYGAGKVLDDAGRPDEAFAWFARANAMRAPKQPKAMLPPFVNSAEAFTREMLLARAGYGLQTSQPIFIIGMPRSGTTLTESLVGAHSKVTAGDERPALGAIARRLGRDSDVDGAYARNIAALQPAEVRALGEEYLERCRSVAGATPHFTDKMPHNFLDLGLIALLFPNARIIHCRRHPVDNCLSLYANSMTDFHNRYKTDLATLGRYYRQYLKLMQHWRTVLPGRFHEVCYEDVVANTELNARGLIAFIGLDWEDRVMERAGSQRSVRTLSHWQVRQPVYQTSKGKWRGYERHLGPLIETLGQANVEAYEAELAALA